MRFPEFKGEWEKSLLGQIANITKGSGISKEQLSNQGIPCILYGELYTKYKSEIINEIYSKTSLNPSALVKSQANDVIIPCSGETAIDISTARCVPYNNVLLGGDLNIIQLKSQDGGFFAYQLNGVRKYDIARIAQGMSVVHLYGENLKRIKVCYPTVEEQRKITSLLSLIDERISTQIKIIEKYESLIKGLRYYILEESTHYNYLGNLCDIIKGQQVNLDNLLKHGKYYVMNGGTQPSGYYNSYNTDAGTISISEGGNSCGYIQYNKENFWSGGHCYTLQNIKSELTKKYLYHYLKSNEKMIMALRVGSGLPNIQKKDLMSLRIPIPAKENQKKISRLLDSIEDKISVETNVLKHEIRQKRYLLRQMFI